MKHIIYLIIGTIFGFALTKGEAVSWYRIQEMFRFESIHMYGIFLTAVPTAAMFVFFIKKFNIRSIKGEPITIPKKPYHHGLTIGGLIFGFGWALTGACPGPLYALIGAGYLVILVSFLSALLGVWVYANVERFLP